MKQMLFTIFLSLFAFSVANSQTSEAISQLMPVPSNIGKFSKKLPKDHSYFEPTIIEFNAKIESVNLPNGKKGAAVTIQTTYYEIAFEPIGGKMTAIINIYGRITSKGKTTDGFFEEKLIITVDDEALLNLPKNPIIVRKVFELPEGKFQIGIIIRDIASGNRGVKLIKFQVPTITTEETSKTTVN